MDNRYEVFCIADRYFYESLDRLSGSTLGGTADSAGAVPPFETAQREVPAGWRSQRSADWLHIDPSTSGETTAGAAPTQGWKIHVSAGLHNADKVAAKVWDYCVPRGIAFKFVPGPQLLHLRNSKYARRDTSGKFVTIYPPDEERLHITLTELGELLDGEAGPYILTDLRWREGPLYVRYGAFAKRFCVGEHGTLVSAIENPQGRLVPDPRTPVFQVPEWVALPGFLAPHLAARNATTVGDLPYRMEKALHFSNGGGVYAGTDTRSGEKVVLKEGRPLAGLASDGADAVARLERERDALQRLSGLGVAPEARDWFTLGDHRFLVMDFLEGRPLNSFFAQRHPLLAPEPDPAALADYTAWALRIHQGVEAAVTAVHRRGVVFNDLHMFNIMVGPDEESVQLLDFEAAAAGDSDARQSVAHPGFMAPPDRRGYDVDRYALACLRLALFLPVTTLFVVDRGKAAHLADVIAGQFPAVPGEFLDEAVAEITRGLDRPPSRGGRFLPAEPADWPAARDSMAAAILASATPDRDDRLFPGDIAQFSDGGGLGLGHGAAGVLHAFEETGLPRYEEGERWLLERTAPLPGGTPFGLYDGAAGIALVLDRLGHTGRALEIVRAVLAENWQRLASDLSGGLAGLGLVLDHLAHTTGETALRDSALEAAHIVATRLSEAEHQAANGSPVKRRAGLLHGATGPALLFLRLYERTGDPVLLDDAALALRLDLDRCVTTATGSLDVDEGWRTMPYLGEGSAGIGMVLDDYLAHRADERFEQARADILLAATFRLYAQPGLFAGRAGMILHLARTTAPGLPDGALAAQIDSLGWYGMDYRGGLAFPGNQMLRLSMDLGTGTAGCLLALGAALGDKPAQLPFLPRRRP